MFGWLARRPALGDDAALQLLETFERMSREALARVLRPEDSQCPWELLEDAVGPASGSDPCVMLVVMVLGGQSEHWVHAALCWWCSVFKVFFFFFFLALFCYLQLTLFFLFVFKCLSTLGEHLKCQAVRKWLHSLSWVLCLISWLLLPGFELGAHVCH